MRYERLTDFVRLAIDLQDNRPELDLSARLASSAETEHQSHSLAARSERHPSLT